VARVDLAKAALGSAWFLPGDAVKVVLVVLIARAFQTVSVPRARSYR
jgi:biotin transport system substrate-specific component